MAFSIVGLDLYESEPPRSVHSGRGLSPEMDQAVTFVKASMGAEWADTATEDELAADWMGEPLQFTVPAGESEYVLGLLRRAANRIGVGIDTQPVNVKGGKTEVRFRARPKRTKAANGAGAAE